jgi:hypothetical protein
MDIHVKIPQKIDFDNYTLQKMTFIYNALEQGWDIKKVDSKYIFSKKHEQQKEIYLDSFLSRFLENNIKLENINTI